MPENELITEIHDDVTRILVILQGNGNPANGLVTKHELLAASVANCQKSHAGQRKDLRFWAMFAVALGSVVVAWIK